MKYLLYKDKKYRKAFFKTERKKIFLRSLYRNMRLMPKYRLKAYLYLLRFSKLTSHVRIKNRCIYTVRAQSVYRDYKVSRLLLKKMVGRGALIGVRKSGW